MRTTTTGLLWVLRIAGLIQVALGLLFWIEIARNLVPVHILLGLALVLVLWILAAMGAFARVGAGLVALAVVWGVVVVALGMTQTQLLPGSFHWIIRVLHLVVGIAAMGLGGALAQRILGSAGRAATAKAA